MILSEEEIRTFVTAPKAKVLEVNEQLQNSNKVHVTGDGYEDIIEQIIGYENVEQHKQKKLLTKPFTKPLTKYIIDAQSRWKTAQGTSRTYEFKEGSEKLSKEFKDVILSQVWKRNDMESFVKKWLANAIYTEFNGFLIVDRGRIKVIDGVPHEIREGRRTQVEEGHEALPYIIFKGVDMVHNFSVDGDSVDWIIYSLDTRKINGKEAKIFRVIDSKFDYEVSVIGSVATIDERIIEHGAGQTPVVSVSTLNQKLNIDKTRTSPLDAVIPHLDYYLNQYGEHVVSSILHAHPIYYQSGLQCKYENEERVKCDQGFLTFEREGKRQQITCPACKGAGVNLRKDASTVIILPKMDDQGNAYNVSNVAGYITPPIDILVQQMKELAAIKSEILESATAQIGSQTLTEKGSGTSKAKTATETVLNLKPLEDIISDISDVIQSREKKLTDIIGKIHYGEKYIGSELIYGKKLNLRDENLILEEIKSAKESGAPYSYIETLVVELIFTRFARSPLDLQRNIITSKLEPFVGYTFKEVEDSGNMTQEKKLIKQNFVDYILQLEIVHGDLIKIKEGQDFRKKIKFMTDELKKFAKADMTIINNSNQNPNQND